MLNWVPLPRRNKVYLHRAYSTSGEHMLLFLVKITPTKSWPLQILLVYKVEFYEWGCIENKELSFSSKLVKRAAAVNTVQTCSLALRAFVLKLDVLRTCELLILTMQHFRKLLFLLRPSELYVPYTVLELDKVWCVKKYLKSSCRWGLGHTHVIFCQAWKIETAINLMEWWTRKCHFGAGALPPWAGMCLTYENTEVHRPFLYEMLIKYFW